MKKALLLLVATFMIFIVCVSAYALPLQRSFQDIKLPTQAMIEHQDIINPVVADANGVLNANAGPTSAAAKNVISGFTNPDVPRNLVITPGGTTVDVKGCTVTVTGTNFFNKAIAEDFVIADNQSTATTGAKAFKTVTKLAFPADCEEGVFGANWSIGVGEKIGLKRCLNVAGDFAWSTVSGAYEATRATVVADVDEIEKNTADFNGTMDGTADFQAYFVQNFRCFP